MSDLISRQDAINIASRECGEFKGIFGRIKDGLEALPSAQPDVPERNVGKWTPASDPPKEKGDYFVTYHPCYWDDVSEEIKVGIDNFRGKSAWAKTKYQRVVAWMPLPEPYRPEGGEADV